MKKRFITLLCSTLFVIPGCRANKQQPKTTKKPKTEIVKRTVFIDRKSRETASEAVLPAITVWVHGSTTTRPLSDYVHGCPDGLHKIMDLSKKYRLRSFAKELSIVAPTRFPVDHFYAFGWPGDLDFALRENEARKLYAELQKLVAAYRMQYGVDPVIRLITHSHGGNVALNLAKVKDPKDTFTVEAILMACPIQKATSALAASPFFSKVYSLYSTMDMIQVVDIQGMYKIPENEKRTLTFSGRRLDWSPSLRQARLTINRHGLPHLAFITRSFVGMLPAIIDEIDRWEAEDASGCNPEAERILAIKTFKMPWEKEAKQEVAS